MPAVRRPYVVLFDVNETLTDMAPLAARLERVGVPGHLLTAWFAGVLRDGVALTLAGGHASFAAVAGEGLRALAAAEEGAGDPEQAAAYVLAGLPELPLHPDVPRGVRALHAAGYRLATLTNGSADTTRAVLDRAGLADCFTTHLDVAGPGRWKPARETYAYALDTVGVAADEALLVSVHPWDVDGAGRAGLTTAWLRRTSHPYPSVARPADLTATSLPDLAARLGAE
ncbi:haloacid dehalogenase type II [Streptomyces durhamensis]|uniref:haloacid dehalogenase type II n=1 Tax=Streptomyces durhamensis TaxID=68194 RepID=UPI0004CD21D1|nr:haloacid dehalogenase type II [Streptomyces durhamensis]